MAKLTLLQIVQRILSIIDGDNVTDVGETVESEQVVELIKTVYEDLMVEFPWYHKRETVNLEVTPVAHKMKLPSGVEQLLSDDVIFYNDKEVYWISPNNMRDLLLRRDETEANIDSNGAITDRDPEYWSSYDDEYIIFDSYDTSLVSSLSEVWAAVNPTVASSNTELLDLPYNLQSVLIFGVLEHAFRTLKGDETAAGKYESKYVKQKARAKRWARRVNKENNPGSEIDYGRRRTGLRRREIPSSFITEGS